MKTSPVDYSTFYNLGRKEFFRHHNSYNIFRKSENLAYLVGLETGLRASDLLTLKFSDIEFASKINNYTFTCFIKKTKGYHTGIISNELFNYINNFKNELIKIHGYNSDFIFYNYSTNKVYSRQWLFKRIKLVAKGLNLSNCGVHSIRKASAINVLEKTGSLAIAQYHLSHQRATTTDKYLGVSKESALERLSKIY